MMTPEQMEEARNEADNHADIPVGELLDLALKEIKSLRSRTEGRCVEPGCEITTRSRLPRHCMEHR